MGLCYQLGRLSSTLRGQSLYLRQRQLLVMRRDIIRFTNDLDSAKALFTQSGEDREVVIFADMHPLCDGSSGEAFRQQTVKEAFCPLGRKSFLLQWQADRDGPCVLTMQIGIVICKAAA